MIFRIRYAVAGGHVHCRFLSGAHDGALGKCGDLVMRSTEFDAFRKAATFMQFLEEPAERARRRQEFVRAGHSASCAGPPLED